MISSDKCTTAFASFAGDLDPQPMIRVLKAKLRQQLRHRERSSVYKDILAALEAGLSVPAIYKLFIAKPLPTKAKEKKSKTKKKKTPDPNPFDIIPI